MQRQKRHVVASFVKIRILLRREIKADVRKQLDLYVNNLVGDVKVSKGTKIRNRYNQVPHLTQDTNGKVTNSQANPRDFYRYTDGKKKGAQCIPPLKKRSESGVAQSDLVKAEEFNGQFTGMFDKNEHIQVPNLDRSTHFMGTICVSEERVTKIFKGLNPSKALESDELYHKFLKELATWLGPVFSHLFKQSIDTVEI